MSHEGNIVDLVRRAVSEPLMITRGDEVHFPRALIAWAEELAGRYPLWAFRPHAFAALNVGDLPSTHPLPAVAASVARDEGLGDLPDTGVDVSLESVVDSRRCDLVLDDRPSWLNPYAYSEETEGEVRLLGSFGGVRFPSVVEGPILAYFEPESNDTVGGYVSPYEEIGLELVRLVEDQEAARAGSDERASARRSLDEFIRNVARRVGGRPTVISRAAATRIVEQGYEVLGILWDALATDVALSPATADALDAVVTDGGNAQDWAIRLAVPIFSVAEIRALRAGSRASEGVPKESLTPAERFTLQVLAHRLQMPVGTIAHKVMNGWTAEQAEADSRCIICGQEHRATGA